MSYRYRITGQGFEFEHVEESGLKLRVGSVVKQPLGPGEYRVTKIVKEPRAVFGFSAPLLSSRGIAEAEPFVRAG